MVNYRKIYSNWTGYEIYWAKLFGNKCYMLGFGSKVTYSNQMGYHYNMMGLCLGLLMNVGLDTNIE